MDDEYKQTQAYQDYLNYYGDAADKLLKGHDIPAALEKVYGQPFQNNGSYKMSSQMAKAISDPNLRSNTNANNDYAEEQADGYRTYTMGGIRDDGTAYQYNMAYRIGKDGMPEYNPDVPSTYQEGKAGEKMGEAKPITSPFQFYDDYMAHLNYKKVSPGVYRNDNGHVIYNNINHGNIVDAEKAARAKWEAEKAASAKPTASAQPVAMAQPSRSLQGLRAMRANRQAKSLLA